MIKSLLNSLSSYGKAIEFIFKYRIYYYFLIPLLLNILLLGGLISVAESLFSAFQDSIMAYLNFEDWDFWASEFLKDTIVFIIHLIIQLFFFILFAIAGGYVILILLSPLLSYISEKTEKILSNKEYAFSWSQLFSDALRGIKISVRNFFKETIAALVLFFLSFTPIIGLVTVPALFLISSYFFGFSFLDYNLERRKMSTAESIGFMKANKGLVIGNGIPFALCLLVPFIGITLAGFVSIVSTVAATILLDKKQEELKQIRP